MASLRDSLSEIPLLSEAETERAWRSVHELRPHWIQRHEELPFFTLGAASYLDATNGRFAAYQERARLSNPLLSEHFEWLLARLAAGFSDQVGKPAVYSEHLALPGFHVFLADPAFGKETASIHCDLQYQGIDWSQVGEVDTRDQRSLTLSIRLPAAGGGLRIWDIDSREMALLSPEEQRERRSANRSPSFIPYKPGWLVIHSGHHLHQIAAMKEQRPEDERVTLQAHAVSASDRWVVYW